ncbi:hypothetical protein SAMN05421747_11751 [Parapedobacter composti]|uniref:Uncharacterized protein n=1 Tax=Parapedobacter composti TaxID=623281 RepID=A0A1I1KVV8_9SPHI|nr:hypothetical protein SAMN05421747_11751 [Parapedobacter composti]
MNDNQSHLTSGLLKTLTISVNKNNGSCYFSEALYHASIK